MYSVLHIYFFPEYATSVCLFPHQASVTDFMPALSHFFFPKHIHVCINKIASVTFYSNVMLQSDWQVSVILFYFEITHFSVDSDIFNIQTNVLFKCTKTVKCI